jgi:hypothetical protein
MNRVVEADPPWVSGGGGGCRDGISRPGALRDAPYRVARGVVV